MWKGKRPLWERSAVTWFIGHKVLVALDSLLQKLGVHTETAVSLSKIVHLSGVCGCPQGTFPRPLPWEEKALLFFCRKPTTPRLCSLGIWLFRYCSRLLCKYHHYHQPSYYNSYRTVHLQVVNTNYHKVTKNDGLTFISKIPLALLSPNIRHFSLVSLSSSVLCQPKQGIPQHAKHHSPTLSNMCSLSLLLLCWIFLITTLFLAC